MLETPDVQDTQLCSSRTKRHLSLQAAFRSCTLSEALSGVVIFPFFPVLNVAQGALDFLKHGCFQYRPGRYVGRQVGT